MSEDSERVMGETAGPAAGDGLEERIEPEQGELQPGGAEPGGTEEAERERLVEVARLKLKKRGPGRPRIYVDHEKIVELRREGASFEEISEKCGIAVSRVRQVIAYAAPKLYKTPKQPAFRLEPYLTKAIEMRAAGASFTKIAKACGISTDKARRVVYLSAPELRKSRPFEDEAEAAKAVAMKRAGATFAEIGKEFGIWGHVVQKAFEALKVPFQLGRDVTVARQSTEVETPASDAAQAGPKKRPRPSWEKESARLLREAANLQTSMFRFDVEKAVRLRHEGWDYVTISKAVGASRPVVMNAIKTYLLVEEPKEPKREKKERVPKFDVPRAVEMINAGYSYRAIGKALGVSTVVITRNLKKMGHRSRRSLPPPLDVERAVEMIKEGYSYLAIGKALGVSTPNITRKLEEMGHRSRRSLPPVDVERAVEMRRQGARYSTIARAMGVPFYRVHNKIRGWEKRHAKNAAVAGEAGSGQAGSAEPGERIATETGPSE
jgi:uncharacterized protein YerC